MLWTCVRDASGRSPSKDNVLIIVRTLERPDALIGTDNTMETIGLDELTVLRMNSTDLSERTCKRQIDAVRRFVRFVTGTDPLRARLNWNVNDEYAPSRKFITLKQWHLLIKDVDARTYLVLVLGGALGLRRAEIAGIRLDDIHDGILTIHGKGHGSNGKESQLRIPPSVSAAIEAYLPERASFIELYGDNSEGYLLIQD